MEAKERLIIGNTVVEYELRRSSRAKRVIINIREGEVKVSVPTGISFELARGFVEQKKDWVLQHLQAQLAAASEASIPKKFVDGEKFLYLGREYSLRTIAHSGKKVMLEFKGEFIWIFIPETVSRLEWPMMVKNILEKWYRQRAKQVLTEKLTYFAKIMGVSYQELRIREQKTRWGSCSKIGNINFNWRIMMAPVPVIDYLVVHELAHRRYMNHSQNYWLFVASFLPEYQRLRKWLKDNGKKLII